MKAASAGAGSVEKTKHPQAQEECDAVPEKNCSCCGRPTGTPYAKTVDGGYLCSKTCDEQMPRSAWGAPTFA